MLQIKSNPSPSDTTSNTSWPQSFLNEAAALWGKALQRNRGHRRRLGAGDAEDNYGSPAQANQKRNVRLNSLTRNRDCVIANSKLARSGMMKAVQMHLFFLRNTNEQTRAALEDFNGNVGGYSGRCLCHDD